ncbi:MAG: YihY/virulence factor BrkB family protein [Bryobacterales bacterium]|nr:YihY/virulence factor BrkB family protein [Bryobacterales bacterium]
MPSKLRPPSLRLTPGSRAAEWFLPTVRYWLEVEVHVYALSVAAGVLLSFFPFLIVMVSICQYLLEWPDAVRAIYYAISQAFPSELSSFITRNLRATVASRGPFQAFSVFLLLFTANAIFVPFEVALNRAWGVSKNRGYVKNQLVSFAMVFLTGCLAMLSFVITAGKTEVLTRLAYELLALPVGILSLVLVYWLLPNRKVSLRRVLPVAVVIGVLLSILKLFVVTFWPLFKQKLMHEYGPFYISVTIVLWSFLAAMLALAGAEWSARPRGLNEEIPPP